MWTQLAISGFAFTTAGMLHAPGAAGAKRKNQQKTSKHSYKSSFEPSLRIDDVVKSLNSVVCLEKNKTDRSCFVRAAFKSANYGPEIVFMSLCPLCLGTVLVNCQGASVSIHVNTDKAALSEVAVRRSSLWLQKEV